ncbi:MAG: Enoyl-[acyl-carrier-protein] reductase [Thermomicrobiales bacterium]|nr:Enoyl-[acyl-carrier-protein] reductase [Thermomicrobiales bacterium]
MRNDFFAGWHGREDALVAALDTETPAYQRAYQDGDFDIAAIFVGEVVDLIDAIMPAGELVQRIGADAEARLRAGPAFLT